MFDNQKTIEKYDAEESQQVLSNIMPLVALSPAIAPLIGAFFLSYWGWQSIFVCLALLGVMLILMTQFFVKADKPSAESIKAEKNKAMTFKQMLANPFYVGNVMIFAACSGAFFSYLTLWPAVMDKFGFDATAIGLSFIPQTIMFIVGGYGGKILIKRLGSQTALKVQLGLFFTTTILISILTIVFEMTTIYPLLIVFAFMAAANNTELTTSIDNYTASNNIMVGTYTAITYTQAVDEFVISWDDSGYGTGWNGYRDRIWDRRSWGLLSISGSGIRLSGRGKCRRGFRGG